MSLKDVNIKIKYDSDEDDLLKDFYIPMLSQANEYYRLSGFFNSSSLAVSACGLENFIKNNGKMKLVTSIIFSEKDLKRINEAEENPMKIIEENFIEDLNNVSEKFVKDHLAALGWMIAHDYLEIKVAYPNDFNSLFHPKVGILKDSNENIVSFSGSDNETRSGWLNNIEEFKVFASWKSGHPEIIESDINSFYKYWNNFANKVNVIEIPKAIKKDLIKLAPDNIDNLNFHELPNYGGGEYIQKDERKLRFYQQEALDSWFDNRCRGIFELATGTGKTFTALKCLEKLYKCEDIVCVIACPLIYLVEQWEKDVNKFPIFENVYKIYGSNSNWKKDLNDFMFNLDLDIVDNGIIITTHNTFSNPDFKDILENCNKKLCLIVDEMHHVGAEKFSKGLTNLNYEYRLGLSATPSVYMNDDATDFLMDYFGGIVSSFTIQDALTHIDPETGEYYLCEYNYYPIRVMLNGRELEDYKKLSNMIRIEYFKNNSDSEKLIRLLNNRSQILKSAEDKDIKLREILNKYDDLDHLIIFTTYNQKERVLRILGEEKVSPRHEFTSNVGANIVKELGMSEREVLIDKFDKGKLKALVAIKCLDEGVDVPSADKVIIMSSSTNPMEYVQRRGRVLRKFSGKKIATIFDMVILPEDDGLDLTRNIRDAETKRLYDFIESAKNKLECYAILDEWGI